MIAAAQISTGTAGLANAPNLQPAATPSASKSAFPGILANASFPAVPSAAAFGRGSSARSAKQQATAPAQTPPAIPAPPAGMNFSAAFASTTGIAQAGPASAPPLNPAAATADFAASGDVASSGSGTENATNADAAASRTGSPFTASAARTDAPQMAASQLATSKAPEAAAAACARIFDLAFATSGPAPQSAQISAAPGANDTASDANSASAEFSQIAELSLAELMPTTDSMAIAPGAASLPNGASGQQCLASADSTSDGLGKPFSDLAPVAKLAAPEKSPTGPGANAAGGSSIAVSASISSVLPVTNASNLLSAFSTLLANSHALHVSISLTAPGETPAQSIGDRTAGEVPSASPAPPKEGLRQQAAVDGAAQSSGSATAQVAQTSSDGEAFNEQTESDGGEKRSTDRAPVAPAGATSSPANGVGTTEGAFAAGISTTLNQGAAIASATPAATGSASSQQSAAANSPAPTAPTPAAPGGTTVNVPSQPAASDTIRAAELLARASNSEMHLSIRTEELGTVELRAALHQDSLSATIGVTRGDVQAVLSSELPGLHQAMAEHSLRFETFNVMKGSLGSLTGNSGGFQPPHQNPQRSRANSAFPAIARVDSGQELDARPSSGGVAAVDSSPRLSIHV